MPGTIAVDIAHLLDPHLLDPHFNEQLQSLSLRLKSKYPALEKKLSQCLQQAGYDRQTRGALQRCLPLASLRSLGEHQSLPDVLNKVAEAGVELARMNVPPADAIRALQVCSEVVNSGVDTLETVRVREQLNFCTALVLNHAYHQVRETESRAFQELFHIEVESSNIDVLLRRFLDSMSEVCGAIAAHAFVLEADKQLWELRASTATAPSSKTKAITPATIAYQRALSKPLHVKDASRILDPGWPEQYPCVWSIPLQDAGVMQFAFPEERRLLPRDIELLTAAGERCHAALQKTRTLEDIALREAQLRRLAVRMLMVEENERRRISRELHDDAGQSLVVIRLQMELIEQSLKPHTEERERLAEARDLTEKTILDIRRLIADLSPSVLEQLGLGAALRQLTNRFRNRYSCQVQLQIGELPPLDTNFQLIIYRLAQECFNNISQHSGASNVIISVSVADRVLRLHVEDNGSGFDVEQALQSKDSFGLVGIRERVAVLGGNVVFSSTPKLGQIRGRRKKSGTVIQIELPIP